MCRLSLRLPIVPFVLLCLRFSFVLVCLLLWLGDLTTLFFLFSWYCTQIASKDTPLLPPRLSFPAFHTRLQYQYFGVVCGTV